MSGTVGGDHHGRFCENCVHLGYRGPDRGPLGEAPPTGGAAFWWCGRPGLAELLGVAELPHLDTKRLQALSPVDQRLEGSCGRGGAFWEDRWAAERERLEHEKASRRALRRSARRL